MVGERLGDRTHLCANVVGLFLALHGLSLQPILALTHIMVYEYSRNDFRGQQARERTKEKGGYGPGAMSWVSVRTMRYIKRVIRSCRSCPGPRRSGPSSSDAWCTSSAALCAWVCWIILIVLVYYLLYV